MSASFLRAWTRPHLTWTAAPHARTSSAWPGLWSCSTSRNARSDQIRTLTFAHILRPNGSKCNSLSIIKTCIRGNNNNNNHFLTTSAARWMTISQQRVFATRKGGSVDTPSEGEDEEFQDDNGMTMKDREKVENWARNFTKDSIPKGLLTLHFVRASGPGGQNVNKVNTKVDMRFVVDEALWLPEYVRDQLNSKESNRINKNGEYVLTSDRKRTQMANLDDCMEKLHDILLKMAELPKLPDAETLEKLERIKKAGNNRRKLNKQLQSQKKSSRRVSRDD